MSYTLSGHSLLMYNANENNLVHSYKKFDKFTLNIGTLKLSTSFKQSKNLYKWCPLNKASFLYFKVLSILDTSSDRNLVTSETTSYIIISK